jgi:hypothetical protein
MLPGPHARLVLSLHPMRHMGQSGAYSPPYRHPECPPHAMRMIDTAHTWAPKTLVGYQGDIYHFHRFLDSFQLPQPHNRDLPPTLPHDTTVLLLWSIQHHTLQSSSHATQEFVGYSGAQSLCSALGLLHTWTLALGPAGSAYRSQHQVFGPKGISPSDDLLTSMTLGGMSRRLGTESRPPKAIWVEHVWWIIAHRTRLL